MGEASNCCGHGRISIASGLAGVSAASITSYLYYPSALGLLAALSIVFRFPRKYS